MKFNRYIFGAAALFFMLGAVMPAVAQSVKLKCLEWNIKSFEYTDNSNAVHFSVTEVVDLIKAEAPDIICFNEFETAAGRMGSVEKLTECAQMLNMFPYVIYSYAKDGGVYGNGILSKYPIVNAQSKLLDMFDGTDQRSVGWIDILVPTDAKPDGTKVRVVCTHLDAFGTVVMYEQAKQVIAYAVKPAVDQNIPVILMGDMNTWYESDAIKEFEKTGTRLCNNTGTFGGSKLDYFIGFPKGKWTCSDYKVSKGGRFNIISDHYPIMGTAVLQN